MCVSPAPRDELGRSSRAALSKHPSAKDVHPSIAAREMKEELAIGLPAVGPHRGMDFVSVVLAQGGGAVSPQGSAWLVHTACLCIHAAALGCNSCRHLSPGLLPELTGGFVVADALQPAMQPSLLGLPWLPRPWALDGLVLLEF
jgi:hypothetical protein